MNTSDKQKKETLQFMYGEWRGEGEVKEDGASVFKYTLEIGRETTKFTVKQNDIVLKDDEFETSGMHWFDDYLWYVDTRKYFITYADEKQIVFGELSTLGTFDGKYEFYLKLKRVE